MPGALKKLNKNAGVFFLFEIPFRILLIFLFTEGGSRIVDVLLHFQGYSYVTQNNYRKFLTHPSAVILLCLTGLVLLFLILYEFCGLFLLLDTSSREEKISLGTLTLLAGKQTLDFIRRYPFRWFLFLLLCLPNLYLHLILWEVDRARFIDRILTDLYKKTGIPLFVFLGISILLLSMLTSLSLPFRIFGKKPPFGSGVFVFSRKKKKQLRCLLRNILLQLRILAATGFLYLLAAALCVLLIRHTRPVYRYVSDTLFYGNILKLFWGLLIGFTGTITITGYLYSVYRETESSCCTPDTEKTVEGSPWMVLPALLITAAILFYERGTFIPDTAASQDYLEITAHRGGARFAPENTLAAIQYSIDTRADYAEIDVQETADGEIVLLHDNWLARTTGVRKYIWNTTYSELQGYDAGSFFSKRFKGEKIPTLREVIRLSRGKLRLNIEIKANGHNKDIVPKVLDVISQENFQSNCVITSMDYSFLKEIKELSPDVVTGYTLSMVYGRVEDMDAADFYSVKYTFVDSRLVDRIHEMGKQICAWTTNSRPAIRSMIDAGVDNVITDDPELVRKELMREYDVIPGFLPLLRYMLQ